MRLTYTVGVEGMPICTGREKHCLKIQPAAWLSIVKNHTNKKLFLLQGFRFHKQNNTKDTTDHPPDLPISTQPIFIEMSEWAHWMNCRGEIGRVLLNTSSGSVIDWSP